jgi:hypothetical protein
MRGPQHQYQVSAQWQGGDYVRDAVLVRDDGEIKLLPGVPPIMRPEEARSLGEALIQAADWAIEQMKVPA